MSKPAEPCSGSSPAKSLPEIPAKFHSHLWDVDHPVQDCRGFLRCPDLFLVAPSCCSLFCSPLKSLQYIPISRVLFALLCNKTCSKTQLFLGPYLQETKRSFNFPPKNIPQVHPPGRARLPSRGNEHTCAWELTPSGPGMWSHFHHQMGREVITGSVPQQRLETNLSGGPSHLGCMSAHSNIF